MKNIGVFCSASDVAEKYTRAATEFATLLAKNGYGLVWGASDTGMMKIIASTVEVNGGRLTGVSMPRFESVARQNIDELIVAKDLSERKAILLEKSDAIVALVGGIGTLDEVSEIISLRKIGSHNKPIVILNTENFYSGLKDQMEKMKADGFIQQDLEEYVHFAKTPEEAMNFIDEKLHNS